jgi:hypothetical protein
VPQFNVITIPGDTTGTWASDNTIGIALHFAMACGSTFTAPSANAWIAGNYVAAPGQTNGVAATTDQFRITGVTVLPGNEAPSAARSPFIMRPYGPELTVCQRYLGAYSVAGVSIPIFGMTNAAVVFLPVPVPLRSTPTIVTPWNDVNYTGTTPTLTGQWTLLLPGIAYVARTGGAIAITGIGNNSVAAVTLTGATFNNNATTLLSAPTMQQPVMLDARL